MVPLCCDFREETVAWDPAGASAEDVDAVDAEVEGFPVGVGVLDQLACAEAYELGTAGGYDVVAMELCA